MSRLNDAELRVWLFGCRQTKGFQKEQDTIAIRQIADGVVKDDGSHLSYGTALKRRAISAVLNRLESKGLLKRSFRPGRTTRYQFLCPAEPVRADAHPRVHGNAQVPLHADAHGGARGCTPPMHGDAPTKEIVGRNPSKETRTEESKNPSRPTNGRYTPTIDDARAFARLMFTATSKAEKPETALSWLRLATRARGWPDIERVLRDKLARNNPPRNNAWFRKVLENEYGLSPDDKDSKVEELKQRFRNALRRPPEERNVECMRAVEEAQNHGRWVFT